MQHPRWQERADRGNRIEYVGVNITSPRYPLDVDGDVNCSGVYRIDGVPITAFREKPILGVGELNHLKGAVHIVGSQYIDVVKEGQNIVIKSLERTPEKNVRRINGLQGDIIIESGDNVTLGREGNKIVINSDPGQWEDYKPTISDKKGRVREARCEGQYIVYGPICHLQCHAEVDHAVTTPVRITIPIAPAGSVRQSINGWPLIETYIEIDERRGSYLIGGSYRIE